MKRWLVAFAWILCSAWVHAEALVSPPPLNNSGNGIMFDMTALTNVTVTGLHSAFINNTTTVGTHTFAVFTKAGTHVGSEGTPGAWTLLGTTTFTLNPGQQNRAFDFPMSVPIAANTTQGFYLSSNLTVNFRYNYRSAPAGSLGSVVTADANLALRYGSAVQNFGAPTISRAFVGTAIYRTAATVPTDVTAISGTPQNATASTAFAPLAVRVTGSGGVPMPGATVTFAAPGAGASATLGAATCVTNAVGECSVGATASATAGAYNVQATVAGVATPAGFALNNLTPTPNAVTAISGTPQSATASTAFAALAVRVTGAGAAPVPGATVTFAAPGAGASATLGAATCVTDAAGECSVGATANATAGAYNVQAIVAGVAAPANFALTNLAGPPPPVVVAAPAAIPTLGEWAMAALAALLAALGMRRRRAAG